MVRRVGWWDIVHVGRLAKELPTVLKSANVNGKTARPRLKGQSCGGVLKLALQIRGAGARGGRGLRYHSHTRRSSYLRSGTAQNQLNMAAKTTETSAQDGVTLTAALKLPLACWYCLMVSLVVIWIPVGHMVAGR